MDKLFKRDFKVIADILSHVPDCPIKDRLVDEFVDYLKTTNKNFDEDLFRFSAKLGEGDMNDAIASFTDDVLIPNWYVKDDVEKWIGFRLSDDEFKRIVRKWNHEGFVEPITDLLSDFANKAYDEMKKEEGQ